jgi:hypothetical protein
LPSILGFWARETRHLGAVAPGLSGLPEFLRALEFPENIKQSAIPDFRKLIPLFQPAELQDENFGRQLERQASVLSFRNEALRVQEALCAETVEVNEQGVHLVISGDQEVRGVELDGVSNERLVKALNLAREKWRKVAMDKLEKLNELADVGRDFLSMLIGMGDFEEAPIVEICFPYVEGSVEKVQYQIDDGSLKITITPVGSLLFRESDLVFTNGDYLPVLEEEQLDEMERIRDTATTKLVISIPVPRTGSVRKTLWYLVGNYLHLRLQGNIFSSFDESEVQFERIAANGRL